MENFALKQLSQIIYEYCGLNYLTNLRSLETKIAKRLEELNSSIWNYIRILEKSPAEWDILIELLTINETYFYREDKQLSVYRNRILPHFQKDSPGKQLKVWSAACSTGEEPYSLAMTTLDSGIYLPGDVHIVGSDINRKVLQTAVNGIYNKQSLSFRRIPPIWLETYFKEEETQFCIQEQVKKMVKFKYTNLLDEQTMKSETGYDVIFCRNVLIYFDTATIRKVAEYFYQSLKKGGYLFLGHAESISTMNIGFETINQDGTFYYRKGE